MRKVLHYVHIALFAVSIPLFLTDVAAEFYYAFSHKRRGVPRWCENCKVYGAFLFSVGATWYGVKESWNSTSGEAYGDRTGDDWRPPPRD